MQVKDDISRKISGEFNGTYYFYRYNKNIEVRMLIIILFILSLQLLKHVYRCLTQSTSQWKICH